MEPIPDKSVVLNVEVLKDKTIVTAGEEGVVHVWKIGTNTPLKSISVGEGKRLSRMKLTKTTIQMEYQPSFQK